jgi:hypothetical protein
MSHDAQLPSALWNIGLIDTECVDPDRNIVRPVAAKIMKGIPKIPPNAELYPIKKDDLIIVLTVAPHV